VHIEKGRGIHGEHARPFEARLAIADGRTVWSMKEVEDVERARVATLLDLGFSIRDIAEEADPHRSKVHRLKQRIEGGSGGRGRGQTSRHCRRGCNQHRAISGDLRVQSDQRIQDWNSSAIVLLPARIIFDTLCSEKPVKRLPASFYALPTGREPVR
jgi:hypothetical protein